MLTVAMIVKNEVETLERTVESVREFVDGVIIGVDTESDDGTRDVAEKIADKVIDINLSKELAAKESVDDDPDWGFSKARNRVLDECSDQSWRLILDGHEVVHGGDKLDKIMESAAETGCDSVNAVIHFEPDENGIAQTIYSQVRILAPTVRYRNPIHNVPVTGRTFSPKGFIVEHRKKDQSITSKKQRDVQRSDSSIEGLKKKVAENPGEPRSLFYLATAYKENARWQEAIQTYLQYLDVAFWKEERWHARTNLGACYSVTGQKEKAREQFSRALDEFPDMVEAYYYMADMAYKGQKFREAQVWLERCIDMDVPECQLFVNPKVYMVDRYDLLAMVYNHLGEYEKAIETAQMALDVAPNARIQNNVEIWSKLTGGKSAA